MTDAVTVVRLREWAPGSDPVRVVVNAAGRVDLALTDRLHDETLPRPYATARAGSALDAICFADDLARALLAGSPGAVIAARKTPAEIAAGFVGRTARLAFLSPTRFRVAGLDYLLPDPFHLFGGLLDRWQGLGWPEQIVPNVRRLAAEPERLQVEIHRDGPTRRGFVGVVAYDLVGLSAEERAAAWALLRFGEWRGVGAHTSYGCGRVRLLRPGETGERARSAWAA
ncbi:MAG: CRISPR system precrRNA processing endoribonuclease RAMP protein Cas6 [Thermomicrobiales bacterium]|nr:CRISPR system precrRNA processing endoribonuclease RAMP protein Cas6 [Thermomicrobiales bacterium]